MNISGGLEREKKRTLLGVWGWGGGIGFLLKNLTHQNSTLLTNISAKGGEGGGGREKKKRKAF
jgi:hypothetical protein